MMKNSNPYLILLLIVMCQIAFAQQKTKSEKDTTIPFELTGYNNLSVQAVLNQKDTVHLMFHTAASSMTVTAEAAQKLKSVHFDAVTDDIQSWGGQSNSSRLSKGNLVQIGNLKWEDVSIWENTNSGQNTDGKFGLNLFENKIIEIDFEKKIIVTHNSLPAKVKKYQKLKLYFEEDDMFLEAGCIIDGITIKNKFLIHTGYGGTLLLDDVFVAEHNIGDKLKVVGEKQLKDSFGNVIKTKKAILPLFQIGTTTLSDVPVGFFDGAIGRQKKSIIGGDLLKRFTILLDAKREYAYLKPNHLKGTPYLNI